MKLPNSIIICGIEYKMIYFDSAIEVDEEKRSALYGQIVYDKREIRILKGNRKYNDILQTIMHEIMHAIDDILLLDLFCNLKLHKKMDALSITLLDTLKRNGLIK
jgi:hypothetical protein